MMHQLIVISACAAGVGLSLFFLCTVAFGVWEDCVDPMLAGKRYDKEIWFYGVGLMVLCLIALVGTLHMTRAAL